MIPVKNTVILSIFLLLCACASTITDKQFQIKSTVLTSDRTMGQDYTLSPGDHISVSVYRMPELSSECLIRPDGKISLPLIDYVKAAGKTIEQLDEEITRLFLERVIKPEVTINVMEFTEPMIYVFGEVNQPGPIPFNQIKTVAQAIALAGGLRTSAAKDSIAIIRVNAAGKLEANILEGPLNAQPDYFMSLNTMPVRPEDMIVVPESDRSQFVRWINDFINTPFTGIAQAANIYVLFRVAEDY